MPILLAISAKADEKAVPVLSYQISPNFAAAVKQTFPDSAILANSVTCYEGKKLQGLIISQNGRLHALLGVESDNKWTVNDLDTSISYKHGAMSDFLSDYENADREYMEVRCTVPNLDKDISIKANGEFMNGFDKKRLNNSNHICFTASNVYNSWACYSLKPGTMTPVVSFIQMNAD